MTSSFFGHQALRLPRPWLTSRTRSNAWTGREAGIPARLTALLPGCLCFAGLAACAGISFFLGQGFAFTGFLFVVPVVLAALYGGFWQATLVSVAAVACLDYFFIPPIFSFANSPANWVALGAFEFTALIISRLSLRAQLRADEAVAGRRDMERLYETSRRILLLDGSTEPGNLLTALIREIFDLNGVLLVDGRSGTTHQSGELRPGAESHVRKVLASGEDWFDPKTQAWYCALRIEKRLFGGLALARTNMNPLAATALASLCGIAMDRSRALQRESRAEAARQMEQLRTAVLDALAHQFKTPLTIARTASSGLLALGGLSELQTDLVGVIDEQASVMDHLASRLLGAGMLDSTEFQPKREPLLLSDLVGQAVRELQPETDRSRVNISVDGREMCVPADRELILTALAQLLDNAVKYSEPRSPIEVIIEVRGTSVTLTMLNRGPIVTPPDCERIFERFYRAPETQRMPSGTGLGLSIVKKIVEAHQGSAWAEGQADGTSLSIALPTSPGC